jgi:intracellular septation protein A
MNLMYFFLIILPLIAFVIADTFGGLKWGVLSAITCAILAFIANIILMGTWEPTSIIEPALILVLGLLALKLNNARWFKFQPVIVNGAIAILLAYYQIFDQPFLVKYFPLMKAAVPPENQALFDNPLIIPALAKISLHCIFLMIAHGLLVAWAATRKSNWTWIGMRLAIYPLLLALMLFDLFPVVQGSAP